MKIQVTENHIKKGIPDNCTKCAISLALKDALEGYNLFEVEVITDIADDEFRFVFREQRDTGEGYEKTDYVISQTDAVNVNHFIGEFDTFGYDEYKQESIPCLSLIHISEPTRPY